MKHTLILLLLSALLLTGCLSSRPMDAYVIEYYPPATPEEQAQGHGALKMADYRKPRGTVTIFGFTLF